RAWPRSSRPRTGGPRSCPRASGPKRPNPRPPPALRPCRCQKNSMSLNRSLATLRLGLKSIRVHPLRSSLTVLGIVLGVASVILMLAVGEAARYQAIQQIKDLGATNIIVRSVKPVEDDKKNKQEGLLRYGLTSRDVQRIESPIPTVVSVTPL